MTGVWICNSSSTRRCQKLGYVASAFYHLTMTAVDVKPDATSVERRITTQRTVKSARPTATSTATGKSTTSDGAHVWWPRSGPGSTSKSSMRMHLPRYQSRTNQELKTMRWWYPREIPREKSDCKQYQEDPRTDKDDKPVQTN